jgi:hypothetical protein
MFFNLSTSSCGNSLACNALKYSVESVTYFNLVQSIVQYQHLEVLFVLISDEAIKFFNSSFFLWSVLASIKNLHLIDTRWLNKMMEIVLLIPYPP